ncbi:MAG: LytTR family DNA-binding domain-containing protein [Myxococcota bacterium]
MTHRAFIVDDEPFARVALKDLLSERGDVVVVGEAHSVKTAAEGIAAASPDVVFLDVRLQDGTGFDVMERVQGSAHVIFVTAHSDHALRAFEVNALDYLVKPVQRRHLDRALGRLGVRSPGVEPSPWPAPVIPSRSTVGEQTPMRLDSRVCLQRGTSIVFARLSDIVFLRAVRDYTEVHLASGRVQKIKESLQAWESRVPSPPFARIYRSVIVNLLFLEELNAHDGNWHVVLRGVEAPLPVSRRHVAELKQRVQ